MDWDNLTPLPFSFYHRSTLQVAPDLLGCLLIHRHQDQLLAGRIVETEAYVQDDPACHAYPNFQRLKAGKPVAGRSALLFGKPGTAYIYLNYGIHWLFNVVTEAEGVAGAVLVRALEPVAGLDEMRRRRPKVSSDLQLTSGPGKLTQAMAIEPKYNGVSLLGGELFIAQHPHLKASQSQIRRTPRIGISKAKDKPWRYLIAASPYVSLSS